MKRDTLTLPLDLAPELIIDNFTGLVVMNMTFTPRINGPLSKAGEFSLAITDVDSRYARRKSVSVVGLLECVDIVPDLNFSWGDPKRGSHGAPLRRQKGILA